MAAKTKETFGTVSAVSGVPSEAVDVRMGTWSTPGLNELRVTVEPEGFSAGLCWNGEDVRVMTSAARTGSFGDRVRSSQDDACDSAAVRMYDAEVALHCARQSGVDAWIAAAYERLHVAIETYVAAAVLPLPAASTSSWAAEG